MSRPFYNIFEFCMNESDQFFNEILIMIFEFGMNESDQFFNGIQIMILRTARTAKIRPTRPNNAKSCQSYHHHFREGGPQ